MDNLPSTAVGVLDLFSASRAGIDIFSDQIIESVKTGETNALKVRVWIKTIEEILDRVKKETNDNQLNEAQKYSESVFEYAGAKIEKAELGTRYDYSVCCDPIFERLEVDSIKANADLKERQEFLKALKKPLTVVDDNTGEVSTIYPPLKKSTSGLKVSIQ